VRRGDIELEHASRSFSVRADRGRTLKELVFRRGSDGPPPVRALHDVSLRVGRGETVGLIGRNGAGKSSTLKVLAGIIPLQEGRAEAGGRVVSLLELGAGFGRDFSGRENIELNGALHGLRREEVAERMDAIIAFSELGEFIDVPVRTYSSGMFVRLGFAIAAHLDADVLLIDEVLAVGDAAFQQKCFDEFARIRERGTTVLLVTHDISAVERFCDRALLLERGRIVQIGEPREVGERYMDLNFAGRGRDDGVAHAPSERYGDGRAEILDAWIEIEGARVTAVPHRSLCAFAMRIAFREAIENPLFGVQVFNDRGDHVTAANNSKLGPSGSFRAGDAVEVQIGFDALMAPGRYYFTPAVADAGTGLAWLDRRERMLTTVVTGTDEYGALVALPFEFDIQRVAPHARAADPAGADDGH
jgi:ABC-type polysaccharide/polyol phosphate transport system ATPase subunit